MNTTPLPRTSGVLLHPTSLPSPYGIGDLGSAAYEFIDFLEASGQHIWQVLPLTHTGFGDSPYQSFSSYAGQPLIISPEHLIELSLLTDSDLADHPRIAPDRVDYGAVIPWKMALLRKAYEQFCRITSGTLPEDYRIFCETHAGWLDDYALFLALKDLNQGACWLDWPEEFRTPSAAEKEYFLEIYEKEAGFYRFIQFLFFTEWTALKEYANQKQIKIIGDIPIFVSMDSADVWANPHLFQLDSKGFPTGVAGVPPDYFCETGQLWGNPLYNWDAHEEDGYEWWISRVAHQLQLVDILRIDHFRGFEAYWCVPYGEPTAVNGKWLKGPEDKLFSAIEYALGDGLPIIAEDLGVITPEVEKLRDSFDFPGMKVLQFAFEGTGESNFLPHNFQTCNCVCYTGTHDNDTTKGWFETLRDDCRQKLLAYLNISEDQFTSFDLIRLCFASTAAYAIVPMQDLLNLGKEGRMNRPGAASGNWGWRYEAGALTDELADRLKKLSCLYGRY